jgi:multiple sugar transport system substrate-binding protein
MKLPNLSRRSALRGAAAVGGATALGGFDGFAKAWAQSAQWKPEAGAKLNVLRWKRFVPAEDDAFMAMVQAFSKATGVEVNITNESFDDIQPKASVAANTGQGPDLVWGLHSLPHLFPDKVADLTDVANYLGKKYGGWVPAAEGTCKKGDKWIGIPVAFNGGYINYRVKAMNDAGFKEFPKDTAGLLELCKALKAKNTPSGFAMGHATGDANAWLHWILWSHGGYLIDKENKVSINSPETAKSLEYCKALYETFIPGTASWNDSSNNKAFLSGELFLTANGISIYAAANADAAKGDAKMKAIAEDMDHAVFPVGPVGKPQELQLCFPILQFQYTKVPNAGKAFIAYMMEAEQYGPWLSAAVGYLTQPLNDYEKLPFWTADPKRTVYRDAAKRTLTAAGAGQMDEKAASAIADFIVVDMFASYCTGGTDLKGAIAQAERSAKRLYR